MYGLAVHAEHAVQGGILLDRVVLKRVALLEPCAFEGETLLVWRDMFLVLDLGLDIIYHVCRQTSSGMALLQSFRSSDSNWRETDSIFRFQLKSSCTWR